MRQYDEIKSGIEVLGLLEEGAHELLLLLLSGYALMFDQFFLVLVFFYCIILAKLSQLGNLFPKQGRQIPQKHSLILLTFFLKLHKLSNRIFLLHFQLIYFLFLCLLLLFLLFVVLGEFPPKFLHYILAKLLNQYHTQNNIFFQSELNSKRGIILILSRLQHECLKLPQNMLEVILIPAKLGVQVFRSYLHIVHSISTKHDKLTKVELDVGIERMVLIVMKEEAMLIMMIVENTIIFFTNIRCVDHYLYFVII